MDFRILGPLEVEADGRALQLGGAKQRGLLAALILSADEVVSVDRLIDDLWGEQPPKTAVKAVQVYVSRLRKQLGTDVLQSRAPGYLLAVDPQQVDVGRFERLVAEARDAPPKTAAILLREALALWRGPPLADIQFEPFALSEIARLEELRVAAVEARVDADLAMGRHADLVGELEGLVLRHPLRERLRVQLMLALYRSDRQAEALQVYQNARLVLVDELGIEPSRTLHELERAILSQDPALDVPQQAGAEVTARSDEAKPVAGPAASVAVGSEERKLASVLFADLVSLEQLEEQDPERTRAQLERFYEAMADEVGQAGGTLDRSVGGAIMATFGVPTAREDHAERALDAALAMQRRVRNLFGDSLGLRIGVNTGEVVVGRARDEGSFVVGHAINVAARLAQAAALGEILVGARTVVVAQDAFEFGDSTSAASEVTSGVVPHRRLLRAVTKTGLRGVRGLRRSFVAREQELELLQSAYERAVHGREPHLLTIMGEAGVGKTTLAREFCEWLSDQWPKPRLRIGRCLPYGRGITYWALGEVLKEQLGVLESDPPETIRQRLGEDEILGLTLGLDVAPELHPLVARERLHDAWVELVSELAAECPLVMLVEGLHWAEIPLLDLLDQLLRDVSGPLLLLATARPELLDSSPAWGAGRRHAAQLWLEPLSAEEATRMLEELLGAELPDALRRLVLANAEGNPFFLEELVAALIDRGFLVRQNGGWQIRDLPARLDVPDTIQSVLAARIDLLGAAEKAALQAASVVGRVFWAGPVIELLDADADWGVLVERDFIRRRPRSSMAGEREFAFKHALTRDVAYAGLPKARRARLHAAVAAWLERMGEGRDEHAPLLAHHYFEAVRGEDVDLTWPDDETEVRRLREKALAWLLRAAELARARYALDEQISLLRRAVEVEPNQARRSHLWREIAHAHALNFDDQAFIEAVQRAIDSCSNEEQLADLYAEAAFQSAVRWQQEGDRERIDDWSRRVLELSENPTRARAHALVARAICHPEEAARAAREAEAIATRLDDPELHSYALYVRADVALAAGAYDEACDIVEQRLEVLARIDDPDHRADAYWAALPAYLGSGRFDEARRIAHLHDEEAAGLTSHHRLHGVAVLLEVEQLAGNWERIGALTRRAEQAVEQSTTRCLHSRLALLTCALASAYRGEEEEARRLEARSEETGIDLYGRAESLIWLALHRGDLDSVERQLEELERPRKSFLRSRKQAPLAARLDALAALGKREELERDAPTLLRPGSYLEPFALRALGIARDDEALLARAQAAFVALGLQGHAAQTRKLAGRVLEGNR
jgi:DNA-binding SARP family transcriptional activator